MIQMAKVSFQIDNEIMAKWKIEISKKSNIFSFQLFSKIFHVTLDVSIRNLIKNSNIYCFRWPKYQFKSMIDSWQNKKIEIIQKSQIFIC